MSSTETKSYKEMGDTKVSGGEKVSQAKKKN